jgi:hypothetical protein
MSTTSVPLLSRLILLWPGRVARGLEHVRSAGLAPDVPNVWQITLGVLRMMHRVLFRSDTIGTCKTHPVRRTWRARLLAFRALRLPFLLWERAVAPLDFSGLVSSRERVLRHLLGAHHDAVAFVYDLELLRLHPGALEECRDRARAVVEGTDPRAEWLRDLVVYEGYHEALLATTERAIAGTLEMDPHEERDPDVTFAGYLAWCAAQPETPADTWAALRAGRYRIDRGMAPQESFA